ncbi:MAG TPA: hypothetical protein V6C65_08490 [Allocoleopsis sp.]
MKDIQHDQLFAELTPEQAALIQGGAYRLDSIECLTASADPLGGDEPYINADGKKIWSASMEQGESLLIGKTITDPSISLYDDDSDNSFNPDDPIGFVTLDSSGTAYLGGGDGNSYYRLKYTVV